MRNNTIIKFYKQIKATFYLIAIDLFLVTLFTVQNISNFYFCCPKESKGKVDCVEAPIRVVISPYQGQDGGDSET